MKLTGWKSRSAAALAEHYPFDISGHRIDTQGYGLDGMDASSVAG